MSDEEEDFSDGNMFPDSDDNDDTTGENFEGGGGVKRKVGDSEEEDTRQDEATKGSGKKKRKIKKLNETKKLHKPPTVEELHRLRETENLFHSNLFRRQIEEMLKELELKNKYKVRVNSWFDKFKDWLLKMEDGDDKFDLSKSDWLKARKIILPIPSIKKIHKGWYQFKRPTKISICGSYVSQTLLGPGAIDILIEVPQDFFQKEDYLNGRYHYKRAIYLYELASHLQLMHDLVEEVKFSTNEEDLRLPGLEVVPSGKLKTNTKFIVHLAPAGGSFKQNRFLPAKNNVRPRWFFGENCSLNEECPTPAYNSGVLRECRLEDNDRYLQQVIGQNEQIRDGVILLKVWLRQRELHLGLGAFSGFLTAMLVAYLLHIRKLNLTMSSYQIVRNVWNYLSTADWKNNGITLCDTSSSDHQTSLHQFHDNFSVVFLDPSGLLNLCAWMSPLVFEQCKEEAILALRYLDAPDINSFQVLFMTQAPFSRLCDQIIVFHDAEELNRLALDNCSAEDKLDHCGLMHTVGRNMLVDLLTRGLGDRKRGLYLKLKPRSSWSLGKKPRKGRSLALGLTLDPDHCFGAVDKGPMADPDGTAEFREFWGERSELRRFKDGSITEAVVWDAATWHEKRLISRQIVMYLLETKCGVNEDDYKFIADQIETVLPEDRESRTAEVLSAFDNLNKQLRDLDGLPLEVISVQGTSSVFRNSELFPPKLPAPRKNEQEVKKKKKVKKIPTFGVCEGVSEDARDVPEWCLPAQVIIQLSASNKWPRDLEAVRRIRAAFNLKISQLLSKAGRVLTHPFQDGCDVLTRTCLFRLQVCYSGEIALMKKSATPEGLVEYKDTDESLRLEKMSVHLPKITSALHGLHSQHTSLGTACCLAKRWVRAHLVDEDHLSDEAIDLLMAAVYLNPAPWRPPNQPQTAFLRFLHRLAHTNWNIEFILLNFNDELTREDIRGIEGNFDTSRATLPPLYIVTPYDRERSVWTRGSCTPVVLLRLLGLAQRSYALFESQLYSADPLDVKTMFKPSLTAFDVQIHLLPEFVPRLYETITSETEQHQPLKASNDGKPLDVIPVVGFDPVKSYIAELRESYGEWALFFYDPYGGATIGVLWKPGCDEPRDVKVSHLHCRYLEGNRLLLNKNSILEGFHLLGTGLVDSVLVKENAQFLPFPRK